MSATRPRDDGAGAAGGSGRSPESAAPGAGAGLPAHHRHVRSFVRREGRFTPAQAEALRRHWPRYGLDLEDAPQAAARFPRPAELVLEIGFGAGDALLWRAEQDAGRNYLGIEVHRPGVGRLLHRAAAAGVDNLRVACEDAVAFLQAMPEGSLAEVIVEFPDPWPKKRHHKRRLIQPAFVATLCQRLRPGGLLRLATDWQDYAEHMLAVLEAEPRLANVQPEGGFAPRFEGRPPTRFENRGVKRGHAIFDLAFRRR